MAPFDSSIQQTNLATSPPYSAAATRTTPQLVSFRPRGMGSRTRTSSPPATMADAVTAGAAPLLPGLPDEIVIWEILVRLPPKSLLRCRAVCPAWRRTTSTRPFLLAHHGRQPSLPVVFGYQKTLIGYHKNILAFDHRSGHAQLQPVARLDNAKCFCLEASCDGLVILSTRTTTTRRFSVCNPATRQLALLRQLPASSLFSVLGMYLHGPSGEYRLLLYRTSNGASIIGELLPEGKVGCYVLALGSDQPLRYIGGPEEASALCFDRPAVLGDSLHWSPVKHQSGSTLVIVFDTTSESFRQMPAPVVFTKSYIFEMDGTLAIYSYNDAMEIVYICVLPNYEAGVWEYKYQVELPVAEIRGQIGKVEGSWHVSVVSADGDVLLLVSYGQWLFYVDIDGKLVESFHRDDQQLSSSRLLLKQTLVPHTFFTALEDYGMNASPFI